MLMPVWRDGTLSSNRHSELRLLQTGSPPGFHRQSRVLAEIEMLETSASDRAVMAEGPQLARREQYES